MQNNLYYKLYYEIIPFMPGYRVIIVNDDGEIISDGVVNTWLDVVLLSEKYDCVSITHVKG